MSKAPYTPPAYGAEAFNCPHCGAYAHQIWSRWKNGIGVNPDEEEVFLTSFCYRINKCSRCQKTCLWLDRELLFPDSHGMPSANGDLPVDVKRLYDEAASIVQKSPRAAAALLRVALEMLLKELNAKGENLYEKIESLKIRLDLSDNAVKEMTLIRKAGNAAVHSGEINFNEKKGIAEALFDFVNYIADEAITRPRERKERAEEIENRLLEDEDAF